MSYKECSKHNYPCALKQLAINEELKIDEIKESWVKLYCSHCAYHTMQYV